METFGIIILTFWIATSLLLIIFSKWVRKILKFELFWKIFASVVFAYIFYYRYFLDLQDYIANNESKQTVFLTDFCVFAGVISPILIFFKKTRIFFTPIAFWLLIASGVTAYEIVLAKPNDPSFVKWVFLGGGFNNGSFARLHFSMHYLTFIIGLLLLINVNFKKLNLNFLLKNILIMGIYLTYAFVMSRIIHLDHNVTGLVKNDWFGGQYSPATEILQNIWPRPLVWPTVLFIGFGILLVSDIVFVVLFETIGKLVFRRNEKRIKELRT